MKEEEVFSALREVGCCSGCCGRFLGLRNPASYTRIDELAAKYTKPSTSQGVVPDGKEKTENCSLNGDHTPDDKHLSNEQELSDNGQAPSDNVQDAANNGQTASDNGQAAADNGQAHDGPAAKRRKLATCVCCLGILQPQTWDECLTQVQITLNKRGYYDAKTFACALSSPACILLREKSLMYYLQSKIPGFSQQNVTPLKEAWKWSFGPVLERAVGKTLDSGAVSPLLITLNMEYDNDLAELDTLKSMAPSYYEQRSRQSRRFPIDSTRRCVDDALAAAPADAVARGFGVPPPAAAPARLVSVQCCHAPAYIAGRYIKLSRELSQTPWLVDGKRMMESSVQDIIFEPIAKFYGISAQDAEHRLKFVSAGREDVDVRCLGAGRPFAVEVADPHRAPDAAQLRALCRQMSPAGRLRVDALQMVTRDQLTQLKKGEETKAKTYRALCIKLPPDVTGEESAPPEPTVVTDEDLARVRAFRTPDVAEAEKGGEPAGWVVTLQQKTPLRVLHRRPLHTRRRRILSMDAERVPGHPNLLTLSVVTEAGTYVKELVHGDLGRTRPSLRDALAGARVDIVALDVTRVHLDWPPSQPER